MPGITESQMFDGLTIVKGGDYYSKIAYLHVGIENWNMPGKGY